MKTFSSWRLAAGFLVFCMVGFSGQGMAAPAPQLSLRFSDEYQWRQIVGTAEAARIYHIQSSSNLLAWKTIATLFDSTLSGDTTNTSFYFLDPASVFLGQNFYRCFVTVPSITDDWKNQVASLIDGFAATNSFFGPRWVKFSIPLADPVRVFYQDSRAWLFHYDFAAARLDPFRGMTRPAFEAISLHTNGQQVVLGAVLYPFTPLRREVGIQFVGLDPYPPETVAGWFKLVKSTIANAPESIVYIPALEQLGVTEANRDYFASNGIVIGSVEAWLNEGDHVYSPGWALGRLKFFPASEIRAAFNDGRLRSEDILLTDGVPAEVPIVAGIIALTPATPNAHVAILARSYGIPFVYLVEAAERERVQTLVGREIILRARENASLERVKIVDVEETMSAGFREELLALKAPVGIDITPKAAYGAFSASTTNLVPADIRYFGGKAANFGFLRRTVPTNSPDAIAFSFDLWDAFLNQTMFDGRALRAHINERLAGYTYPPNISALTADLDYVRDLIRQSAQFTSAQQQAITNALRQFDPSRKIRFRSSTNVEDAQNFIGAGLYDSYSGCLLDDRDGDSAGPSHCDPEEDGERGVFRAIQRVYASFYNDNAFIERLRLRVNESQVGMAVLVHYSFPDEIEMANGVATVEVSRSFSGNVTLVADLNTQIGATSVTNPDGTSQPEVVHVRQSSSGVTLSFVQGSSLIPRGAYVMNWESDYRALMELVAKVCDGYMSLYTNRNRFNLDFEYKKVQPHGYLELKQVREIPVPTVTNIPGAYLIANPHTYHVTQGECGSPFSVHRLKSVLQLHTRNVRLDQTNFTFMGQMSFECFDGTNFITLAGEMSALSNHMHTVDVQGSHDSWTMTVGSNRWDIRLHVSGVAPSFVSSADPLRFLTDYRLIMYVRYSQPMFDLDSTGNKITVTNDGVCLEVPRTVGLADPPRNAHFDGTNGLSILAEYWTPNFSSGIIKTIPLLAWNRTRITGLTSQPLILTNYYSQSFRPGHHNFYEDYVFEPRLDSNLTPQQQSELAAANIRLLFLRYDPPTSIVWALGLDDAVRQLK